ncbi:GOLPH3/VPS74 family protein [Pseudonocardia spirodelae]|uniref:GPP34 family phosphoprotein n=1 Tax=Pseudonocardia spirodelae TaxID=3133431 RepID=A0ABU8T2R8_9PSEU
MGDLLLSEELLLIGLHDDTGKPAGWFDPQRLHGALLCDLIERGAVTVDERKKVHPAAVPEHPALRAVYDTVAGSSAPRSVAHWTSTLPWKHTKPAELVAGRLVERGVLAREEGRVLGLFRTTRLPEADPGPERALRERLRAVLVTGTTPTAHDALLVALLHGTHQVRAALDGVDGPQRRAGEKRAKEIAKGLQDDPVLKAQYDAAVLAAVMTTVATTVVVTGGSN